MTDTHHAHDHSHDPIEEVEGPPPYHQVMAEAIRELCLEKGIFDAASLQDMIETIDSLTPSNGAAVVARAWVDADYKARLLENGTAAVAELGFEVDPTILTVVENTESTHNLIVCTLCSCYPRMLLGRPPDWYKSRQYRARAVNEPRAVLAEFGTEVPDGIAVRVHDSTADLRYMVLPERPAGTEHLDEAGLADLVTRDAMIGVKRL